MLNVRKWRRGIFISFLHYTSRKELVPWLFYKFVSSRHLLSIFGICFMYLPVKILFCSNFLRYGGTITWQIHTLLEYYHHSWSAWSGLWDEALSNRKCAFSSNSCFEDAFLWYKFIVKPFFRDMMTWLTQKLFDFGNRTDIIRFSRSFRPVLPYSSARTNAFSERQRQFKPDSSALYICDKHRLEMYNSINFYELALRCTIALARRPSTPAQ